MKRLPRKSGVLLPITSLPGPFGIGDLGPEAYRFVDRLAHSGQTYWQILPLNPLGPGNSPYASPSAFGGNPILISPRKLVKDGLLDPKRLSRVPRFPTGRVDYPRVEKWKDGLIQKVQKDFLSKADSNQQAEFEQFCRDHSFWLDDYVLFIALKNQFGGKPWYRWPRPIRRREKNQLKKYEKELAPEMEKLRFYQFIFFRQWEDFRRYAARRGINIIGDIPFFVSHDSADVWGNPHLFLIDEKGKRTALSGAPPSGYFGVSQKWGNPLYDWKAMAGAGYRWWSRRLSAIGSLVDIIRVDHFSGFYACWHIPTGARTSKQGEWVKGPGARIFHIFRERGIELPIIAEALEPDIDREVRKLLRELQFPSVRVLQFGLDQSPDNPHSPGAYPKNSVVYTGTHDTDTAVGWYRDLPIKMKKQALRLLGGGPEAINWKMIRKALSSRADTAIIPVQDICGLGSTARFNSPGQGKGQWEWRLEDGALKSGYLSKLEKLTEESGRG